LAETGDRAGSLEAIKRAVEIREQLAKENFSAHGPNLAVSLSNLSVDLAKTGDRLGGLVAIQRAVEIREQLAKENFNAYGEDLCLSLCIHFFDIEQDMGLLNRLWQVHQQIKHFTHPYFEGSFATEVERMLAKLREQGDEVLVAKLQEIHDALTKPQA
jgi:hypothetical protein